MQPLQKMPIATAAIISFLTADAHAIMIGGRSYVPTGPTETMTSVFTTPDGGISVNTYSGFVQVKVSGFGESAGTNLNDAFYLFSGPLVHDPFYYQLTFGTTTLVALHPAQNAVNFIRYDLDANVEVTPAYVPAYQASHEYRFVLDTGTASPLNLHFGTANGFFADNSGSHTIEITQLTAVPDGGATISLLGGAIAGLVLLRRKA
jgi:hypothetical protein